MARIRTIKPEIAAHEGLFDLERETGLPIRFAWCMLFTVADREGRFHWRPRTLKAQILPHDDIDFSRVLDAWVTRGFVRKYRVGTEVFGWIPSFTRHQVINNREGSSEIPPISEGIEDEQSLANASPTRASRVSHASPTREVHAQAEGKGKEGREGKGKDARPPANVDTFEVLTKLQEVYPPGTYTGVTWHQAEREISKLLDGGETAENLLSLARAFRAQQDAKGSTGTQFVMSPKTFFGEGHWRGPFPLPVTCRPAGAALTWRPDPDEERRFAELKLAPGAA